MSLAVIVPSRGRPQNIAEFAESWRATGSTADLFVGLDNDDPQRDFYPADEDITYIVGPRLRMAGTLNKIATDLAPFYNHIGFAGDDHRFRSVGWQKAICDALDELGTGIAYGNDLLQGERIPTAVFMSSDIIQALGWMALPGARHLFLDDGWRSLGDALGAITYLPDVVIEHLHPVAGKAEWDEGYNLNNSTVTWEHDEAIYKSWLANDLARDVAKIRAFSG